MRCKRVEVYGRVQGVNFREMTRRKALELGLTGRVWNREDGGVEVLVYGSRVGELIKWIEGSPGFSKVEKVEVNDFECEEFEGFEVSRNGGYFSDKLKGVWGFGKRFVRRG